MILYIISKYLSNNDVKNLLLKPEKNDDLSTLSFSLRFFGAPKLYSDLEKIPLASSNFQLLNPNS